MKNLSLLGLSVLVLTATTMADAQGCAFDRPCITRLYTAKSNALMAEVTAVNHDVINTRWSRSGRSGGNTGYAGNGHRTVKILSGTTAGVTYTVGVQGCNKRLLQSSICSGWDHSTIKAY